MTSFTSYRELAKAKRTHTTVIGSPTGSAATRSFSGPTVPHPCIKPTPGPEFREWKYQTHSFVSEGSEKLIGGYTSNQDLNHEKHLGQVQIPLDTIIPSKKAPLDPTKPRFDSLREMKRMKKYHASAIYPSAAAMTSEVRSRSVDASPLASNKSCSMWAKQHSETNEWSSWVPQDAKNSQEFLSNQKKLCTREFKSPPTATPGPIKNDQGLYLSQDKVKNDKLLPGGTQLQSSNTRCKSPSQTHLLKDRHVSQLDFASEKHVHQTGIGERDGSSSPYSRNSFSKKTDMKAAGMVHSPTNVVLFKSDGSNYPIAEPTTPSHLRRDSFKHTSHDQLHIEKQTSSTPIYPVTPPVRDPPHGSPTLSQRRVEREIKVHVRPIDQQVGDDRFESGKCSSPHRTHRKLIPSPSGSPLPKSPCRSPVSPGRISYNSPSYKPGSHYGEAVPPPRYVGIRS